MSPSVQVSKEPLETIDGHLAEGETREEFIEELVKYYESQSNALRESYGGLPQSSPFRGGTRPRNRDREAHRGA